jgi:hypothetical protein
MEGVNFGYVEEIYEYYIFGACSEEIECIRTRPCEAFIATRLSR